MTILGYLFSLPRQYFETAAVPGETGVPDDAPVVASRQLPAPASAPSTSRPAWRESGATCLTCGIGVTAPGFTSPSDQRDHFKSDWHRYNIKRRLAKQPAISLTEFERVLEQGTEVSISGSESDTSEEDDEQEGGVCRGGAGSREGRRKGQQQAATAIPRVTFQAPDGSPFSVWRCLLRQDHVKAPADQPSSPSELLAELRRLRAGCGSWMVVLLRGGHFAATVFKAREAASPSSGAKQASSPDGLEGFDVVAHKTFHRYVVRAKAGGKQSTKDAGGKYARSAGSRLRRYNEAALERDVQDLLASWSPHVASADLIFVHAPASNARSLFSEGQTTLLPANPRLRRVPFVTHRPTFSETKRVLRLLCAVFRPEAAEQLLREQAAAHEADQAEAEAVAAAEALAAASLGPSRDQPGTAGATDTERGPAAHASSAGAAGAGTSGDGAAPPTQTQESPEQPGGAAGSTEAAGAGSEGPLHRAAKAGDPERVRRLLESGHDPCVRDGKGRTPYALAADKDTRDAFRRFMAQHPDRWDYSSSGIPSPLTEEMEAAQQAKKAAHKAKLKAKDAERKAGKGGAAEGPAGTSSAEERRRAAEAEAAAAHKQAVEDEIAKAAAEAAAIASRLNAAAKAPTSSGRGGAGASGKVGGAGGSGGGGGGGGSKAGKAGGGAKGAKGGNAAPTRPAAAAPPTPEELARRRELMAAAAEARLRALTQASQQQQLW